jgi:AcrR family transcriptional regulator
VVADAPKRRIPASARRALLFDAALREFSTHGYEGASLGRIANDAGVTRTVLYDHFPSKRALFDALLEAKHDQLFSHLQEAMARGAPSAQRIRVPSWPSPSASRRRGGCSTPSTRPSTPRWPPTTFGATARPAA